MSDQNEKSPVKGPFDEPDVHRTMAMEVEGKKLWIPRDTLASFSPVFKTMFYGEFAEAKKDMIPLPGKKAADVEEILKYLIPHPNLKEVKILEDLSNAAMILGFAEEYQIYFLRCRAEKELMEFLENSGEETNDCSKFWISV